MFNSLRPTQNLGSPPSSFYCSFSITELFFVFMTTMSRGRTRNNNRARCIGECRFSWEHIRKLISKSKHNLEESNSTLQKLCSNDFIFLPDWDGKERKDGQTHKYKLFLVIRQSLVKHLRLIRPQNSREIVTSVIIPEFTVTVGGKRSHPSYKTLT